MAKRNGMASVEPLDLNAEYTITSTSFLLNGGDGYTMFKEADILANTMLTDNEVVRSYILDKLGGVIPDTYKAAEGRIQIE